LIGNVDIVTITGLAAGTYVVVWSGALHPDGEPTTGMYITIDGISHQSTVPVPDTFDTITCSGMEVVTCTPATVITIWGIGPAGGGPYVDHTHLAVSRVS